MRKLHYIYAGDGLFAIYIMNGGQDTMYYIHKDYLGSYDVITDESGNVLERLSFDPWGRRRNPTDWTFDNVPARHLFDRGYTGHEHLDIFGLINMNGRVYDPWLGRFLSPDPFVQSPGYSQSYNRYSYCLNNPLKYTDPSGYTYKPNDWDMQPSSTAPYFGPGYRGNIGPGSGNHWSDPLRSEWGNFMLMSEQTFTGIYGSEAYANQYICHVIIPSLMRNTSEELKIYQNPYIKGEWGYYEDLASEFTGLHHYYKNGRIHGELSGTVKAKWVSVFSGGLASGGGGRFPLDERVNSYLEYPGRFGDPRDGGSRKHGGSDLYAPVGTNVYAVKGGTVIQNPYKFYRGSYAIEINHGNFIARYSEINVVSGLNTGSIITQGQLIGTVADLSLNKSMLHFEMFSGNATGPLTNRSNLPYMRRSDLIDPTHFLNFGY